MIVTVAKQYLKEFNCVQTNSIEIFVFDRNIWKHLTVGKKKSSGSS